FNSQYQSLQLNVEKRFSKGFSVLANYAWAKTMDDFGNTIPLLGREFNRAVASEHVPHIFHFTTIWDIPVRVMPGVAGRLLNGWELTSVATWQTGLPFSIATGADNSFSSAGFDRADFTGTELSQAKLSGLSHTQLVDRFFDTSLFVSNRVGTF